MTTSLRPACVDALRRVSATEPSDATRSDAARSDAARSDVARSNAARSDVARSNAARDASAELRAARRHVASCPSCASLIDDTGSAERVLATLARHRPTQRPRLRIVLGVIAALQCALALPWLFDVNPVAFLGNDVDSSHLTRDGAIGVIVGVAGLTTALRTRHALAMLVTGIAAIGMQVLSFAIDEHHERVHPLFELSHALVPVILVLIAVIAMRRPAPIDPPDRGPGLRAVR